MSSSIMAIGDSYMSQTVFENSFAGAPFAASVHYATIRKTSEVSPKWPVHRIREYEGSPEETASLLQGHDILALHGAPVTAEVMDANPQLRLIACARGGPVNVDLTAAREREIPVTTTPGKNAPAVADLTIGFMIDLLRNSSKSASNVLASAQSGGHVAESAFEGARWFGKELSGRSLALVGFGHIARLVAQRASALGMDVRAYDPFTNMQASKVQHSNTLAELVSGAEVVSLHARATADNHHMMGEEQFTALAEGAIFINTARESLVDELALLNAIETGKVSGAGLDVFETSGPWRRLAKMPNVILTPHIGGATFETLARGADMLTKEIGRFLMGKEMQWTK